METTDSDSRVGDVESLTDLMVRPEEPEVEDTPDEVEDPETDATEETPDSEDETEEPEGEEDDDTEDEGDDDDQDDDDDDAESDGTKALHTVKVDGEEVEVTLEDLKRGYSGQKYVQQGMKQAADARKQAEEVFNALQNERRQVTEYLSNIQSGLKPPPQEPDKAMFQTDPIGYMEAKIRFDEESAQYNSQIQQLQQVAGQQSQADQVAMQTYLKGELQQLQAIDPDFRDRKSAEKVRAVMEEKGKEIYGYDPTEIGQITDHRAIRVLRDAIRYNELVSGKAKKQEPKNTGPQKVVKKGVKKRNPNAVSRRRKQEQRLRKSGSIDDALDLLFQK